MLSAAGGRLKRPSLRNSLLGAQDSSAYVAT